MQPTDMEEVYRKLPPGEIPWEMEEPPRALLDLVESGTMPPCKAIDLGCGTGWYSIYVASKGFDVTGVDISPTAIRIAQENAAKKGIDCRFIIADLCGDLSEIRGTFDFAYDWELLHHLFPEDRKKYIKNVHKLLNPGAPYLSVCFSEDNPQFGGEGKYRETPIGTVLYFSSENELKNLFRPYFEIQELKTIQIAGKFAPHQAVYAFLTRK
jgi:SAM-dependent methyltransferase